MSGVSLDWNAVRPLDGSRASGFEELCAQLARVESPAGSRFERKGPPDAGVECYAVLADGREWGWQAKYFDTLGDSQWSQLDHSVETALEKHPRLVRYFVCVPLDRPDPRVEGRRSAKQRWDEHVEKWAGWASARGMTVEFVYWGRHELLERLVHPQHVARVRFWFDARRFDPAWFTARLDEGLKTAGPRYTREIHVDLPIAAEFEAFGRTERFFDRIKARARGILARLRSFEYSEAKPGDQALDASSSGLSSQVRGILTELGGVTVQPIGALPFQRIADQVAAALTGVDEMERLLWEREREYEARSASEGVSAPSSSGRRDPFRDRLYSLTALSSELRKAREAFVQAEAIAGRVLMLLKGDAGMGKTHLLCDVARERIHAGRPTVLLMGQGFVSTEAPWTQALQHLDLADLSAEEFVGALDAAAQAAGCRALVMIDAINEGEGTRIWPSNLAAFLAQLERSPWIGVVLAVRSSYEDVIVPKEVRDRGACLTHEGFAEHEYDAARTFFIHYGLELPSTPLLAPEFRKPLFLKTLCRGLQAKGERRLPRSLHGITAVFDLYLGDINGRLAELLGFDVPLLRGTQGEDSGDGEDRRLLQAEELERDRARAQQERGAAFTALESVLTEKHAHILGEVLTAKNSEDGGRRPPRFDLRLIQRYVLWRVFELGWTTERFGQFDRFSIGYHGREASKGERIGKKYQWIAYHEIMALVADHFQYREQFRQDDGDEDYDGPWQDRFRDIDPSCTLRATPGGTSWHGHAPAWWGGARYENWDDPSGPREWVMRSDDLPKVEDLLSVSHPDDASRWLNLQGYFNWQQRPPADRESTDVERRELWFMCTGYLVRGEDADAFVNWAEGVDFWGSWMPQPPEVYGMFLGEHGWSPASRYFQQPYFGDEGWTLPNQGCPVKVRAAAFEYVREARGFDCSVDERYKLRLPAIELLTGLGLRWSGSGVDYLDAAGRLAAFDPTAHADGPDALLLREDPLQDFLAREKLAICWAVLGEKRVLGAGFQPAHQASLQMSGVYLLGDKGPFGFLKCTLDDGRRESPESSPSPLATIRTPR